jgi:SAM-dependent methyltransferase
MREETYEVFYQLDLTHWFPCGRRKILRTLIDRFAHKPRRIADIGCGTGANLEAFAEIAPVTGVDFSVQAIRYCRQRGFLATAVAAMPNLPFGESFDLVCAIDVIEHIEDDARAVRELLRICRPGGVLLVTVPAYQWLWSDHDDANQHKRRYTRAQLRRLFSSLPVDILKLTHFNLFLSGPIILLRLLRKLRPRLRRAYTPRLDLAETPKLLNQILLSILAAERFLLAHVDFAAGISIACVVRKR